MRKKIWIPLLALVAAGFVSAGPVAADEKKEGMMKEGMKEGKAYVKLSDYPGVTTDAEGKAKFRLSEDGGTLHYKLKVEKISDVTMAHIHAVGEGGAPGPILVWLYPSDGQAPSLKAGKVSGMLAEGEITADKIGGPMKGKSAKELYAAIGHGKAGVAVHTKAHPKGEIWGTRGTSEHGKMEGKMDREEHEKKMK